MARSIFVMALLLLVGGLRRAPWAPAAALATAALALYLTAVHTVLQAEPRYATAYRAIEVLLIATCLQRLASGWRPGRATQTPKLSTTD